jgi:hypothetical protein
VRANPKYVSDLAERTFLTTVNLMPCGDFVYPNQQYQSDIERIKMQHKTEAVNEAYMKYIDWLANLVQATLQADPNFQKQQFEKSEQIAAQNQPYLMGGGRQQ